MNKVLTFNPTNIKYASIPEYFNAELNTVYNNEKVNFITFVYNDLYDNMQKPEEFIGKYKEFMLKYDLPFIFFPYYAYFNKILPLEMAIPNPKLEITIAKTKDVIHVVTTVASGFLMLNVKKLKSINFKFNEEFPVVFYLQDLSQKCFENKLSLSNCCYIDRKDSWKELKTQTTQGYQIATTDFNKEKEVYDKLGYAYHDLQTYINCLKEKVDK
jgi:hypothetical protein